MRVSLTPAYIAALPKDVETCVWDSTVRGFGFARRRAADGTMLDRYLARKRLGKLMPKMTLDAQSVSFTQAQDAAKDWLAEIQLKKNPRAAQKAMLEEQSRITYVDAVTDYLAVKVKKLRTSSFRQAKLYLTNPGYFGFKKPLAAITRSDIATRLDAISSENGVETAKRARSILYTMFKWAINKGHVDVNPVALTEVEEPEETTPEVVRVLNADELKAVWDACGADDDYSRIIRLLILTGCRRDEVGGMRWSEFDLQQGTFTIPVERSKNKRAHTLPLPAMALDIIRSIPQRVGCDHLFASKGFSMWSRSKKLLDGASGVKAWKLHHIRHTVSTGMNDIGIDPHIVDATLNHLANRQKMERRYNHSEYLVQKAQTLIRWADHVNSVVTGEPRKIEPLPRAA
jgi:integrase